MIRVHKRGRYFAVFDDDVLIALCVYRKGAQYVKERLDSLQAVVDRLKAQQRGATCANP
jgi:hypothetical protein